METTLRAAGTDQLQEEGGKRAMKQFFSFSFSQSNSAMAVLTVPAVPKPFIHWQFDWVVCWLLNCKPANLGYVYQPYYRDHDDS